MSRKRKSRSTASRDKKSRGKKSTTRGAKQQAPRPLPGDKELGEEARDKSGLRLGFLLFGLALVVRLVYLYQSSDSPSFDAPIIDAKTYDDIARGLVNGDANYRFFVQAPLYPLILSGIYYLTGASIVWAKVAQMVLGAVTCVLIYCLGQKIFSRRVGFWAGLMAVFYGPLIYYQGELLATGLATFWSVVLILLFCATGRRLLAARCGAT